ncbi:MAG: purine-nucleoside phosphorylase [Alphaproteobacteria bacterium]|nr:purine-nucleoside phosphorylase [Alphaproteobacteria bacterium]
MPRSPEDILSDLSTATEAIRGRFGSPPDVAVVLGSGLGRLSESLERAERAPYEALGLPRTGVAGHSGSLVVGELEGARVALLSGRVHGYEDRPCDELVRGVRAMSRWGASRVLLTSAVGGLHVRWAPGTLVLISDHINLMGMNPLVGPALPELGPRFPDLTHAYDPTLRAQALRCAEASGVPLQEGIYGAMRGPSYETPAEIRMLQQLGADVVGMSMVPEVVALAQLGTPVMGLSVVSNPGAGLLDEPLRHEDVTARVGEAVGGVETLLRALIQEWRA